MDGVSLEARDEQLEQLMERADVNGSQRMSFRSDPERAIPLLEYALARPKIKNPAAFAVTRFRNGDGAPADLRLVEPGQSPYHEVTPEHVRGPATFVNAPLSAAELEDALAFATRSGAPEAALASIRAELDALRSRG